MKTMRTIFTVTFILCLVFSFGILYARGEKKGPAEGEAPKDEIVIGYAPSVYDATDYFGQFDNALREELEKAGISFQVKGRAPLQEADFAAHAEIVEDFITLGVDYIIFGPIDPKTVVPAIKSANEAGIPIMIINHLNSLPEDAGVEILSFFGYSHKTGGITTGEYIVENLLNPGDEAAILYGQPGTLPSDERGFPVRDAMKNAGIKVVYEHHAEWQREKAYDTTERILTAYPNVKLIYGCNSSMAMGAAEAVASHGLTDEIHVVGFGCVSAEIDMIWEGLITAAIFRDAQSNGRQAADAIMRHMQGKEVPERYELDMIMVGGREDILNYIPVVQLQLTENWPEMEEELKKRGKL